MTRNYNTPKVDEKWANDRETHIAVATAIHAISDSARSPEQIWEWPTFAEEDHIYMAMEEYIRHGDFLPEPDGEYRWGQNLVILDPKTDA
jgi:hypothetical protein